MKLHDIYKLIVGKTKNSIHRSRVDTEMVIEIFKNMNIPILEFLDKPKLLD